VEKAKLNRKRGWIPLVHPPRSSVCESSKPCQVYRALNRSSQCSRRTNLSSSYCQPGLGEGTLEASTPPFRAEISKGFGTISMPCFCIGFPYKHMLPPVVAGGTHTQQLGPHFLATKVFPYTNHLLPTSLILIASQPWSCCSSIPLQLPKV
jgi:hypothetical protein